MPDLSPLLDRFQPSAIGAIFNRAAAMRHGGQQLYDFSTGEPDFPTPDHICEAAIAAIHRGETKYVPTDGGFALREAVQRKFARENSLEYSLDQIIAASGAKPLITDILRTIGQKGDDIVLATPAWTSHIGMINLIGANPVFVETDGSTSFRMTPAALDQAMSENTRVVILCAPSNPSGAVYSLNEMNALGEVLRQYPDTWIVSDDLYEHILYDGQQFYSILQAAPDLTERTVLVNGVSKAYAMTGWRIGFAAGPAAVMNGVRKLMSQSTGCPCSISEAAAVAALDGPKDCLKQFISVYQERRDVAVSSLNEISGITCVLPGGAFYLYPKCAGLIGKQTPKGKMINSSADLCNYLLEDWSVVTVPGSGFGLDPYFRMSIATASDEITAGIEKISEAVSALS